MTSGTEDPAVLLLKEQLERGRLRIDAALKEGQTDREAAIAERAAEAAASYALEKAKWDAEHSLHQTYHEAILEVSKGAIDRARSGAEFVEKAAAAIAAIYGAVLGFVFVAGDNPLPARGAVPALFLGLAIAFAAAYLSFHKKAESVEGRLPGSGLRETQENRTFFFDRWMRAGALNKRYAARAAVLALAAGVLFFPAPFVGETSAQPILDLPSEKPVPDEEIEEADQRAARFEADLRIYEAQAMAAIEQSEQAMDQRTNGQVPISWPWWVAAAVILLAVLIGPWLYEKSENP